MLSGEGGYESARAWNNRACSRPGGAEGPSSSNGADLEPQPGLAVDGYVAPQKLQGFCPSQASLPRKELAQDETARQGPVFKLFDSGRGGAAPAPLKKIWPKGRFSRRPLSDPLRQGGRFRRLPSPRRPRH